MSTAGQHRFYAAAALLAGVALAGCEKGPRPIRYGQDECAECKMTLVDQHYGAEFITARGKVFKFDDLNCLTAYARRVANPPDPAAQSVVVDFTRPNHFVTVDQAWFLFHDSLRTPMGSSLAAFAAEAELEVVRRQLGGGGRTLRWPAVKAIPP
jgi:copper chaperone NosL